MSRDSVAAGALSSCSTWSAVSITLLHGRGGAGARGPPPSPGSAAFQRSSVNFLPRREHTGRRACRHEIRSRRTSKSHRTGSRSRRWQWSDRALPLFGV